MPPPGPAATDRSATTMRCSAPGRIVNSCSRRAPPGAVTSTLYRPIGPANANGALPLVCKLAHCQVSRGVTLAVAAVTSDAMITEPYEWFSLRATSDSASSCPDATLRRARSSSAVAFGAATALVPAIHTPLSRPATSTRGDPALAPVGASLRCSAPRGRSVHSETRTRMSEGVRQSAKFSPHTDCPSAIIAAVAIESVRGVGNLSTARSAVTS